MLEKYFKGTVMQNTSILPYKSVAAALIFSVLLGPVGLLYASFWGGIVMVLIGMVVIASKLPVTILIFWILCCIWGVGAVESHNRKILKLSNLNS